MDHKRHAFAALLIVETNDPRLSEEAFATGHETAASTARIRRAVLQHLPKDVQRLVAVMPVEHAIALTTLHEAVGEELFGGLFRRPPPDYVPPTRE
jgi:hypothetical protein